MRAATKLLIAGGLAVALAATLVLLSIRASAPAARVPQDPAATQEVARAAASPRALIRLYREWAGHDDKLDARERILDALLAADEPRRGLKLALEALNGDPTALDDDPMIDGAAARMARLWDKPELYRYGRDLMLVQTADKGRVVLAESLVAHMRGVPESQDHEGQARAWLTNDLVDVFYQSGKPARPRILDSARALGADDAVALMSGAGANELAVAQDRAHQTEVEIQEVRARASDPALRGVQDEIRRLER